LLARAAGSGGFSGDRVRNIGMARMAALPAAQNGRPFVQPHSGRRIGQRVDRATRGHVIDYIDFHLHGWHWPAFNIADMAIVGGAIALVAQSFMSVENPAATKESQ
jgi:signal peptidase II